MANEYYVKFLWVEFPVVVPDPFDPENNTVPRMTPARHGQKVTTAPEPDDPADRESNTVYGLQAYDEKRLKEMGAFFTDVEYDLFKRGVSNDDSPEGTPNLPGDHTATPLETHDLQNAEHPIAFAEFTVEQLAQLIKDETIDVSELLEEVHANPAVADLVLNAEALATGGDPREELVEGINEVINAEKEVPVSRPTHSATRGEWDDYARSIGLDPDAYANKDELVAAVEAKDEA